MLYDVEFGYNNSLRFLKLAINQIQNIEVNANISNKSIKIETTVCNEILTVETTKKSKILIVGIYKPLNSTGEFFVGSVENILKQSGNNTDCF